MIPIIVTLIKYMIIVLIILYTLQCYTVFNLHREKAKRRVLARQIAMIVLLAVFAFLAMFLQTFDKQMLVMLGLNIGYVAAVQVLYRFFYKRASFLLLNNMCMLITIGMIIISRLKVELAYKQMIIVMAGTLLSLLVPVIIRKVRLIRDMTWVYCISGILMLLAVLVLARVSGGAKLSVELTNSGLTLQLSEVVKVIYVFCLAGLLTRNTDFKHIVVTTAIAAAHVLILVISKDLGAALVFFIAYVVMVFVATRNPLYALAALGGGSGASVAAYHLFSHVRTRVDIWRDPFADYQGGGFQVAQALFAICAGGWFGTGLFMGNPTSIPVASQDFIFAAICEELGGIFGVCLILICMNCYLLIVSISMRLSKPFYKLIAMGLGAEYAFQVFLTIGGNIKLIPMTGITLPLVSYGGSSVICTIMMFAIIQGLYIVRSDEHDREILEYEIMMEHKRQQQALLKRRQKNAKNPLFYAIQEEEGYSHEEETLERRIEKETENSLIGR